MPKEHRLMIDEEHNMMAEPDHDRHAINRSFKNFLIAVVFIVVFSVASVFGLYQLAAYFPEKVPWSAGQKVARKNLPADIPLYNGAVLAESQAQGDRLTYKFMLPLGAQSTAYDFYAAEMIKKGWNRLASDGDLLEFYKQNGKRRAIIQIEYLNGKAALLFEITGKPEN